MNSDDRIRMERQVLRFLCQGGRNSPAVEAAENLLKGYSWREPVHGVIFEILQALPPATPSLLRSELPALLTRRGFPDIDWESFLNPHVLSDQQFAILVKQMTGKRPASDSKA